MDMSLESCWNDFREKILLLGVWIKNYLIGSSVGFEEFIVILEIWIRRKNYYFKGIF